MMKSGNRIYSIMLSLLALFFFETSFAQKAYFIDGYHGGVYGHYPKWYTQFIVDKLNENPFWKINLEIEPETWDSVLLREPEALKQFQLLFKDQSTLGRIEYVNPAYGQPYLFNISGESIIRQFSYGIKKLKNYFPSAAFTTYSSEEPCFSSALPQILSSFRFKNASLKNPNTCWGGYTRGFGGELVNWIGPDGTKLITVPRYAVEKLVANSTWQTEAWTNSPDYIKAALNYGIEHPVAMTLQDAGWRNGPWIGNGDKGYQPTEYTTWRNYFQNASIKTPKQDWKFSQEDVLVSLVWGSQILQKLAQQVRVSETKIVAAEKIAAIANVYEKKPWPQTSLDEAWRTLMLSQHHDCWIVPYNGGRGNTWADKVKRWTDNTNRISDSIINIEPVMSENIGGGKIRIYNTTGSKRNEIVKIKLPAGNNFTILDENKKKVPCQVSFYHKDSVQIYFRTSVPAVGFVTYSILYKKPFVQQGAKVSTTKEGNVIMETDLYKLVLDKSKGGTISSLIAKTVGSKEFVDAKNDRRFNELRGYFYDDGGFHSTAENPVNFKILESGPLVLKVQVEGKILDNSFIQTIELRQGEKRIDCSLRIDWKNNIGIGDPWKQHEGVTPAAYRKPFYNDSSKLLAFFPVNFERQIIYKDAPFDVTESKLDNTFFSTWDSIKNNIVLNWVDVYDPGKDVGLALMADHTTSYAHGEKFPLALNVQYSGIGLWGRNHTITGPTEIYYAIVPHAGKWDDAHIPTETNNWNEPLLASLSSEKNLERSLVDATGTGYQVTTVLVDGDDLLVRVFNAEGNSNKKQLSFGVNALAAELIELNGTTKQTLNLKNTATGCSVDLSMPRFGIRTIRLKQFRTK